MTPTTFSFDAIGTAWTIDILDGLSVLRQEEVRNAIMQRIDQFDKDYSRFRSDSLVTRMSKEAGAYAMPEDAPAMLSLYEDLYTLTGGAFTPLIGKVLEDAGYDASYSLKTKELSVPPRWDDALEYDRQLNTLTLKQPSMLDFGAAGKGYLIDIVADVLAAHGVVSFTIDAGGDILHRVSADAANAALAAEREADAHSTAVPGILRVGLEHPDNKELAIGVAELSNQSICGSAGNRRAWADFHHIIDPFSLASPRHIVAVWAIASTTLLADAMTTCLYLMTKPEEREALRKKYSFEYLIVNSDYTVEQTPGFKAELFTS